MTSLTPPTILAVDDDAIVRADLRAILQGAGFTVCPDARDGIEAIAQAAAHSPDLIVLDLALPRLDGFEAASRILRHRDVPILALTGYDDEAVRDRAVAAGARGFISKPFSEPALLRAVRLLLHERPGSDFHLRCLIESMHREGASEQAIVRAVRAAGGGDQRGPSRRSWWRRTPGPRRP
jgi:CheY-like chemotaxis protein